MLSLLSAVWLGSAWERWPLIQEGQGNDHREAHDQGCGSPMANRFFNLVVLERQLDFNLEVRKR